VGYKGEIRRKIDVEEVNMEEGIGGGHFDDQTRIFCFKGEERGIPV
jgi:hypothetical protein